MYFWDDRCLASIRSCMFGFSLQCPICDHCQIDAFSRDITDDVLPTRLTPNKRLLCLFFKYLPIESWF